MLISNKKGFTLIESLCALLVVVTTVTCIVLPILQLKRQQQVFKEEYQQVIDTYQQLVLELDYE